jgi:TusA-related sulfurtransferase
MPEEKVDQRLDLIGEVCPYPTAKTRLILKKGEKLIRLFSILATSNNERR